MMEREHSDPHFDVTARAAAQTRGTAPGSQ